VEEGEGGREEGREGGMNGGVSHQGLFHLSVPVMRWEEEGGREEGMEGGRERYVRGLCSLGGSSVGASSS